ncbi:hypothetical protein Sste5346_009760 [Sporothrix stenoceras]|uniref:Uncharacterized protein n=1 Tax=Sporothrix stenoceras TaxID=5173 RepID=A0ABR3YJK8_9PEZI
MDEKRRSLVSRRLNFIAQTRINADHLSFDYTKHQRAVLAQSLRDALKIQLGAHFNTAQFPDLYRGGALTQLPNYNTGYQLTAESMSVDSVFPYSFSIVDGEIVVVPHAADNCAITILPINFAKSRFLPGWLYYLQRFVAQFDLFKAGEATTADLNSAKRDIITASTQIQRLTVKCYLVRKIRLRQAREAGSDPVLIERLYQRLRFDREEFVSCRLRPGDGPWLYPTPRLPLGKLWSPTDQHRILDICDQLETEFGVTIQRASDGCPVFIDEMPEEWSWRFCTTVISVALKALTERCNGLDETVDDKTTLLLECLFMYSVTTAVNLTDGVWSAQVKSTWKLKYGDLLGLPLVFHRHNPLSVSIGHRLHGKQMRTGWPIASTSIGDRIDELNNILLESRTINLLKSNFPGEKYLFLKDLIRQISLPTSVFDPSVVFSVVPDDLQDFLDYDHNKSAATGLNDSDEEDDIQISDWQAADIVSDLNGSSDEEFRDEHASGDSPSDDLDGLEEWPRRREVPNEEAMSSHDDLPATLRPTTDKGKGVDRSGLSDKPSFPQADQSESDSDIPIAILWKRRQTALRSTLGFAVPSKALAAPDSGDMESRSDESVHREPPTEVPYPQDVIKKFTRDYEVPDSQDSAGLTQEVSERSQSQQTTFNAARSVVVPDSQESFEIPDSQNEGLSIAGSFQHVVSHQGSVIQSATPQDMDIQYTTAVEIESLGGAAPAHQPANRT